MSDNARHKTVWCNRGWYPVYYGFCPSEKAWKREMARLKLNEPYPKSDGNCSTFESNEGNTLCLVTVAEKYDRKRKSDPNGLVGLVIHEATHVWQTVRDTIREKNPSREFEAYALQTISQELLEAYSKTRHATKRRPVKARRRARK